MCALVRNDRKFAGDCHAIWKLWKEMARQVTDLLVLDIMLPDRNGGPGMGGDYCITKPYDPEVLLA